jgi:hypothetical protein
MGEGWICLGCRSIGEKMTISVKELLNIVRLAYDVQVIKREDADEWICSGVFKDDMDQEMTLAVKGREYEPTLVELLFTMAKWKQDGQPPEKVKFNQADAHPIDSLAEISLDDEGVEELA